MDARFDTSKDPRFKRAPRNVRRVEVDGRFAHMFKDKRFVEAPLVDARGQRLRRDAGKVKLQDFYELAGGDSGGGERSGNRRESGKRTSPASEPVASKTVNRSAKSAGSSRKSKGPAAPEEVEESNQETEEFEEDAAHEEEAEEQEDEEEEEEEEEEDECDEEGPEDASMVWQQTQEAIPHGDATRRLAVMGCDWDHVSAGELMVMFRTYLSGKESRNRGGSVSKVTIYPSDYGLKQLERESKEGPVVFDGALAEHSDGPEAESAQQEALRLYQMDRTKYYWALVDCDSLSTASWLYDQMDGIEADGVCPGTLDLRFVPDDLDPPHKSTSEATDTPKKFGAPAMLRSAVGHTKVKCTWDEAPPQRRKDLMRKKFTPNELADMDLKAYLASSSDESEADNSAKGAEELRALVAGSDSDDFPEPFDESGSDDEIGNKGKSSAGKSQKSKGDEMGDMEATFSVKAMGLEDELAERARKQGGQGLHTLESAEPKSAWQKYLEKRKEKRTDKKLKAKEEREKLRAPEKEQTESTKKKGKQSWNFGNRLEEGDGKEDLELLVEDAGGTGDGRGFNLRGPQRRAHDRGLQPKDPNQASQASGLEGSFEVDVTDPRIAKVFSSAEFEIDPTNPEFRKSEGMSKVLKEKRERKTKAPPDKARNMQTTASSSGPSSNASLKRPAPEEKLNQARAADSSHGKSGLKLFASRSKAPDSASANEGKRSESGPTPEHKPAKGKKKRKMKN